MNEAIRTFFTLRSVNLNLIEEGRARSIRTVGIALLIVSLLALAYQIAIFDGSQTSTYLAVASLSGFALTALLTLVLLRQRGPRAAVIMMVIGTVSSALVFTFYYRLDSISTVVLLVPLAMAGVLLNRVGIAITFFLLMVGGSIQHFLHYLDIIPTEAFVPPDVENFLPPIALILSFGAVAGILSVVNNRQRALLTQLTTEARNLRALSEFSGGLNATDNLDALLSEAVDRIRDGFGIYFVQIFLVEPNTGAILRQAVTRVGRATSTERRIMANDPENPIAQVIRTGALLQISIVDAAPFRSEFLPATQSEALFPLRQGGKAIGVLDIHSVQLQHLSATDRAALEAIAVQLGVAIQNVQRAQALERIEEERHRLQEQASRLGRELDRLTQEESGQIWTRYLANRDGGMIGFDWAEGAIQPSLGITDTLQKTYRNVMPQVAVDGGEQVLSVPIVARGQALGVMEFRVPIDKPWDGRSIELARTVAQRLSLTLENIRLFEQARATASRELMVNQIAAQLQTKVDLDALVAEAAHRFAQAVGAVNTQVKFVAPNERMTVFADGRGESQ